MEKWLTNFEKLTGIVSHGEKENSMYVKKVIFSIKMRDNNSITNAILIIIATKSIMMKKLQVFIIQREINKSKVGYALKKVEYLNNK